MMETRCPGCGHRFATALTAGLKGSCPQCLADFVLAEAPSLAGAFRGLEILAVVGEGGMGKVYRARHPQLGRDVAVKTLSPALAGDPEFVERFMREARALASLDHPNIVRVHDVGEDAGTCFIVMEFVDGVPLRSMLGKGLAAREALALIGQICDALEYAHGRGIVHRDIKPENILVDRDGRVKIADFGLAKIKGEGPGVTRTDVVMGTPHYMAPEQVERMKDVDHRADIYSLGVVFYEMLTGELPIGRFAPPSRRKAELDVRLDDVVMRTLEKEPAQRYQRAGEVKEHVTRIGATPAGDSAERPTFSNLLVVAAAVALSLPPIALRLGRTAFDSWLGAGFATAFYATHAAVAALGLATIALSIAARRRRHPAGALLWLGVWTTVCAASLALIPIARRQAPSGWELVGSREWGSTVLPSAPGGDPASDLVDVRPALARLRADVERLHESWAAGGGDGPTRALRAVDAAAESLRLSERTPEQVHHLLYNLTRVARDGELGGAATMLGLRAAAELVERLPEWTNPTIDQDWASCAAFFAKSPWANLKLKTRGGTPGGSVYSETIASQVNVLCARCENLNRMRREAVAGVFAVQTQFLSLWDPSAVYRLVALDGTPDRFLTLARSYEQGRTPPDYAPHLLVALHRVTHDAEACRTFWADRAQAWTKGLYPDGQGVSVARPEAPSRWRWMPLVMADGLRRAKHPMALDLTRALPLRGDAAVAVGMAVLRRAMGEPVDPSSLAAGRRADPDVRDAVALAVALSGAYADAWERESLEAAYPFHASEFPLSDLAAREARVLLGRVAPRKQNWFPLSRGRRWVFTAKDGREVVSTVGDKAVLDGLECWPIDTFGPYERVWIAVTDDEVSVRRIGDTPVDIPLVRGDMTLGTKWGGRGLSGPARVTVPYGGATPVEAGTFITRHVSMEFGGEDGWSINFADAVGPVEMRFSMRSPEYVARQGRAANEILRLKRFEK